MVSHYRISAKIGSGGMGDVYLADDTKLNRRVALKFLPSHLAADTTLRARFTREVQAVAALNHPNIVHVYEVSEYNRRPFFAMEYVEGESLRESMRVGKMPFDQALEYLIGLCEGLEAAHKVGIVHRDLKPANIVVSSSGRVKILDFGLAKRASDPTLTSMGSTLGTICYMSPEQVQGRESDNRSDLFSVGIVFYEMIAGRLPFRGDYDAATLTAIVSEPHEPLLKFRPDAPVRLSAIVDRLLAKEPARRYQTVAELLRDLIQLHDEIKYGTGSPHTPKTEKKSRGVAIAVIAVAVLVIGATALILLNNSKESAVGTADNLDTSSPTDGSSAPDRSATPSTVPLPKPVVDRSAYIADSIATAAESAKLHALRDSIEKERTRLDEANVATKAIDASPQGSGRGGEKTTSSPVESPPAPVKPLQTADRSADSMAIHDAIAQFWETLESGRVKDLRKSYPNMSKDWEKMWRTFVDFAKALDIKSTISKLKFADSEAETTNLIKMAYRDRSGQKSEDVRYGVRLSRQNGQWIIIDMERNR